MNRSCIERHLTVRDQSARLHWRCDATRSEPTGFGGRRVRMNVVKTGPYGFGLVFHVVHMTDDVQALNEWYRDVFDAWMWWAYPELNYLEVEERIASMLIVGDLCIETMAPSDPLNLDAPVARFFHRYGRHLHSVGYFVDDVDGFANRLHDEGVSI